MGLFKKISENEKVKEKKLKFPAVKYQLDDILYFLEKTDLPETLYILNSNDDIDIVEVMMDYDSSSNQFFDKGYYINKIEYKTIEEIKRKIMDDQICDEYNYLTIKCLGDYNNPELLKKAIEYIR